MSLPKKEILNYIAELLLTIVGKGDLEDLNNLSDKLGCKIIVNQSEDDEENILSFSLLDFLNSILLHYNLAFVLNFDLNGNCIKIELDKASNWLKEDNE